MNYFMGIDPGKNGAYAVVNENGTSITYGKFPRIGTEIDLKELRLLFDRLIDDYTVMRLPVDSLTIAIEDVHALFMSSAKSTFNFGGICLALEICICLHGYHKVKPKDWQKLAWEGITKQFKFVKGKKKSDTKKNSLLAVKRMFPDADLRGTVKSTTDHDGIVDALLIAEYCRRTYGK